MTKIRQQRGFTLIELIVVVVLILILVSTVSINLFSGATDKIREEANRLALLIQSAHEHAIMEGGIRAVGISKEEYRFYFVNREGKLEPVEQDDIFHQRALENGITFYTSDIEGYKAEFEPVDPEKKQDETERLIVLFPTGELTAFNLDLELLDQHWHVVGLTDGRIRSLSPEETSSL